MRVLSAGRLLPALLVTATLGAQDATNRDQSHYTELRAEGFPIRRITALPGREAKLRDDDLVIGVVIAGDARAYPVNLMWEPENEVLNDSSADSRSPPPGARSRTARRSMIARSTAGVSTSVPSG